MIHDRADHKIGGNGQVVGILTLVFFLPVVVLMVLVILVSLVLLVGPGSRPLVP
jgi:hypothetical protein